MRSLLVIAALLGLCACGKSRAVADAGRPFDDDPIVPPSPRGPGKARGELATKDDAERALHAAIEEEVEPTYQKQLEVRLGAQYRKYPMHFGPKTIDGIQRMACRKTSGDIGSLPERYRTFGEANAVARDGECWVFYEESWGALAPFAIMDAHTGALVWAGHIGDG